MWFNISRSTFFNIFLFLVTTILLYLVDFIDNNTDFLFFPSFFECPFLINIKFKNLHRSSNSRNRLNTLIRKGIRTFKKFHVWLNNVKI